MKVYTKLVAESLERDPWFRYPAPDLRGRESPNGDTIVRYPVGISYNGGTVVNGKWYAGYEVPDPIVPAGYKLADHGVGLELNSHPPMATMILRKVTAK